MASYYKSRWLVPHCKTTGSIPRIVLNWRTAEKIFDWIPQYTLKTSLKYLGVEQSGYSPTAYFHEAKSCETIYPMFFPDFVELMDSGKFNPSEILEGNFKICKRGRAYGIEYIRDA